MFQREIVKTAETEDELVTQRVEQIEDTIFSGPYKNISNWNRIKRPFRDATDTLQAHKISEMTAQTKIATEEDINSILSGKA